METKILDFGVGGGAHTWYLAREGFDTYGFDGSASAVKKTKEKLAREHLDANIICINGQDIKYEDNFFDAVIDSVCIYANVLEDIVGMYKKVYATLKQGGKILTITFGTKTTGYGTGKKIEEGTYTDITEGNLVNLGACHFFSKEEVINLLTRVALKNISCDVDNYTGNSNNVELLIATGEKLSRLLRT